MTTSVTVLDIRDLTRTRFGEEFLVANSPVLVDGALDDWDLGELHLARLVERFGDRKVQIYNDLFDLVDIRTLAAYAEQMGTPVPQGTYVPYVRWYSAFKSAPGYPWADDIFEAIAGDWRCPSFLPTDGYLLPMSSGGEFQSPATHPFPARGIFISARGARTRLHVDPWASDAVLCQIEGTKHVSMDIPGNADSLLRFLLQPGQLLFLPAGWRHEVETLEASVSITWNFVHMSTWPRFFRYLLASPTAGDSEVLSHFANAHSVPLEVQS